MKRSTPIPFILLVVVAVAALLPKFGPSGRPGRWPHCRRRRRLDAHGLGARAAHDARAFVLLRRHGRVQERGLDHAPEHGGPRHHQPGLGGRGVQPGVRRRLQGADRQPAHLLPVRRGRRRLEREALQDHPPAGLRHVPAQVRDHHAGPDHGLVRGAGPVLVVPPVHGPLQPLHLLPAGPLDLASGGVPLQVGRQGLRRRDGRAHVGGLGGAGRGDVPGASPVAPGQRVPRAGQHPVRDAGDGDASGSAGSASTPARPSRRTVRRPWPSARPTPPRPRRCWAGCSSTG